MSWTEANEKQADWSEMQKQAESGRQVRLARPNGQVKKFGTGEKAKNAGPYQQKLGEQVKDTRDGMGCTVTRS